MSIILDSTKGNTSTAPSPHPTPLLYIVIRVKSCVTNWATALGLKSCTCMASRGQHNSKEWQELEIRKSHDLQALRETEGWKVK